MLPTKEVVSSMVRPRIPAGPPPKGHLVILASTVFFALSVMDYVEIIKRMNEAIFEMFVINYGSLGLYKVVEALKKLANK